MLRKEFVNDLVSHDKEFPFYPKDSRKPLASVGKLTGSDLRWKNKKIQIQRRKCPGVRQGLKCTERPEVTGAWTSTEHWRWFCKLFKRKKWQN